jgi:hypothetical protein
MTGGQRRALFAAARRRGFDRDDLRAMTPAGSVSALTIAQAGELLDRLNAGTEHDRTRGRHRPARLPSGVVRFVTASQRAKIESIRLELGWTPQRLDEFLSGRTYDRGGAMNVIRTSRDGMNVIQLLRGVQANMRRSAARRDGNRTDPNDVNCEMGETDPGGRGGTQQAPDGR